ncbi:hypothetical protein [Paenibacillus polymyxa]|uniref:hypothetical protein n=1 Tax=Paenibacillus polymyxa TaxID=1406 RepID=UPI002ED15F1E|nr:hypothetical protein [Paenibacillus polymyxa]
MTKNYVYLDQYGILHLHNQQEAAQHGKNVVTDLQADESGFPVIEGQGVVYYAREDKAYIRGNKSDGKLIATPPVLKQLAAELL